MKFWLGPMRVYLVTGTKNVQAVLRSSGHLSPDRLAFMVLPTIDNVTPEDLLMFKADKSGRGHIPLDGTPGKDRMWATNHRIILDNLSSQAATTTIGAKYCELLMTKFEEQQKDKWQTIQIFQYIKQEITEAAIISLAGKSILELNPGFIDAMWSFDRLFYPLLLGIPKFIYSAPYRARDAFHKMGTKWLEYAFANYDNNGPDLDWDKIWGTRYVRKHATFFKEKGFNQTSRSGLALASIWA